MQPVYEYSTTVESLGRTVGEIFGVNLSRSNIIKTLHGQGLWGPFFVKTLILLIFLSTVVCTLKTVDSLGNDFTPTFRGVEYFCVIFFTIEYLLRLWVVNGSRILYAVQLMPLIDLASILPSWVNLYTPDRDLLPGFQFLRMLRLINFLATSRRGRKSMVAFMLCWEENQPLLIAASFVGCCVWFITSSLQYIAERDNVRMLHCFPIDSFTEAASTTQGNVAHGSSSTSELIRIQPSCECNDVSSCETSKAASYDCQCDPRFASIPSAMFFTLLNLTGKFPLATKHSTLGRVVTSATAILSVGVFSIPTGLLASALQRAVQVLNSEGDDEDSGDDGGNGDEDEYNDDYYDDYDEDCEDGQAHGNDETVESSNIALGSSEKKHKSREVVRKEEDVGYHSRSVKMDDPDRMLVPGPGTKPTRTISSIALEWKHRRSNTHHNYGSNMHFPLFTTAPWYRNVVRVLIILSCLASMLSTMRSYPPRLLSLLFMVDVVCIAVFGFEQVARIAAAGPEVTLHGLCAGVLPLADIISWMPSFILMLGCGRCVVTTPWAFLTISLFRMLKYERYNQGIWVLKNVIHHSRGMLAIGGMAALCCLMFTSALMYYAERNNPDPDMRKHYSSIPAAVWITLINMSGNTPVCDYTPVGRVVIGMLSVVAFAIFALPVAAVGTGFQQIVGSISSSEEAAAIDKNNNGGDDDSGPTNQSLNTNASRKQAKYRPNGAQQSTTKDMELVHLTGAHSSNASSSEGTPLLAHQQKHTSAYGTQLTLEYGSGASSVGCGGGGKCVADIEQMVDTSDTMGQDNDEDAPEDYDDTVTGSMHGRGWIGHLSQCRKSMRLNSRRTFKQIGCTVSSDGRWFGRISVSATIIAAALEVMSTCRFTRQSAEVQSVMSAVEAGVVIWFTIEYIIRLADAGLSYCTSPLGLLDLIATLPWYVARGILGPYLGVLADRYDGPLRGLRLLRLLRLDAYAPSLSLIGKAMCLCWEGLAVSVYTFMVLWFLFNEWMYLCEQGDTANEQTRHFRSALSSLQYSAYVLTGKYALENLTVSGQVASCIGLVLSVCISAVPASLFASSFVDLLKDETTALRAAKLRLALKLQRLFRRQHKLSYFGGIVRNIVEKQYKKKRHFLGKICDWKNGHSTSAQFTRAIILVLIILNVLAVLLQSMDTVATSVPDVYWNSFELFSVVVFSVDYIANVLLSAYDVNWSFSRKKMIFSSFGIADLLAILPFYVGNFILPLLNGAVDVQFNGREFRIFRVLRLFRLIRLDSQIQAFAHIENVFDRVETVLSATAVVALVVWVATSCVLYYCESETQLRTEADRLAAAQGGEPVIAFESIPDAMYYVATFLGGDTAVYDFTPLGSVVVIFICMFGVALFTIPVGLFFEGFHEVLSSQQQQKI